MKTLLLVGAAFLLLPLNALANETKPAVDPVEACKAKVQFTYHFEMMKIEGDELRNELTHSLADIQKQKRHMQFVGEIAECNELKED